MVFPFSSKGMHLVRSLICFWLAASSYAQNPESVGTGAIRGHVHDAVTQEPLLGANVVLLGTTFGKSTDEKGNFEIVNLPPGTYVVRADADGFAREIYR